MDHTIEFVTRDHSGITTIVTSTGVTDIDAAIDAIQSGTTTYLAGPSSFDHARVRILTALGHAYLFVNWDGSKRNNLHDLAQQMTRPIPLPTRTDLRASPFRAAVDAVRRRARSTGMRARRG